MNGKCGRVMVSAGLAALCYGTSAAFAQVSLGMADSFAVLGGTTVTNVNTPGTIVTGDLGVSPGSAITGFPPGIVNGAIHAADALAGQAQVDLTTAYNTAAGLPCGVDLTGQDLGGLTLTPGVYCFSTSAQLTGTLTLDFQGNANAVFVFKIASTLVTPSGSSVVLLNDGPTSLCNVFWQVGSSATLGTNSTFVGNVLALTSITLNTGAGLTGRALARNGAVSMDTNAVSVTLCAISVPTLPQSFIVLLAFGLSAVGYLRLRRRAGTASR